MTGTLEAIRGRYVAAGYEGVMIVPVTDLDSNAHTIKLRLEIVRGSRLDSGVR